MAVRKIRVCPKCGSDKIKDAKTSVSGWLVPTTYYCEDCGYSGTLYVEVDVDEAEKLKHAMNGNTTEST